MSALCILLYTKNIHWSHLRIQNWPKTTLCSWGVFSCSVVLKNHHLMNVENKIWVYHVLLFSIQILLQVSFLHSKCVCCVFILSNNIFRSWDDGTIESVHRTIKDKAVCVSQHQSSPPWWPCANGPFNLTCEAVVSLVTYWLHNTDAMKTLPVSPLFFTLNQKRAVYNHPVLDFR